MTKQEALSKLELEEGVSSSEIQQQYQEFYNEFHMRITNAPTEHQRTLYKKKLDELTLAFETLGGNSDAEHTEELPGIVESVSEESDDKNVTSVSDKTEMTKETALQVLGLQEEFSKKELDKAYQGKLTACEAGRDNAIAESIKEGYETAINESNTAYNLLKKHVFVPAPKVKTEQTSKPVSNESKKSKQPWLISVLIIGAVGIIGLLIFMFTNNSEEGVAVEEGPLRTENSASDQNKEYVKLKIEADALAENQSWQAALEKYKQAYAIEETEEVSDSIGSMEYFLNLLIVTQGADENELKKVQGETEGSKSQKMVILSPKIETKNLYNLKSFLGRAYDYSGETINSVPHGQGVAKFENGNTYKGQFKDGVIHGFGTFTYSIGSEYVGQISYEKRSGKGTYTSISHIYIGEFMRGFMHGHGTKTCNENYSLPNCRNGKKYVGEYDHNKPVHGKVYDASGKLIYEGSFKDYKPIESYPNRNL